MTYRWSLAVRGLLVVVVGGCGDNGSADPTIAPNGTPSGSVSPATPSPTVSTLERQWAVAAKRAVVRFERVNDEVFNPGRVDNRAAAAADMSGGRSRRRSGGRALQLEVEPQCIV